MRSTAIDRRRALALMAAAAALAAGRGHAAPPPVPRYLATGLDPDGGFRMAAFDGAGREAYAFALPGRAHGIAVRPRSSEAALVARRPGRFAVAFDRLTGSLAARLEAPDGRHFYGHCVYAPDGALFYTTENAFDSGRGVIGVWAADDGYRRVGELEAHGIGPHDVMLMPGGRLLAVANGGVLTHPDSGRAKLNLADMAPSLAYVDRATGALESEVRLAPSLHMLGIRHLACLGSSVAFAMQWEGDPADRPPLLGLHEASGEVTLLQAPDGVQRRFENYTGDACASASGRTVAVSGPRGGVLGFWSAPDRRWLCDVALPDGCALAPALSADGFVAASGEGGVIRIEPRAGTVEPFPTPFLRTGAWDNHMVLLPAPGGAPRAKASIPHGS
jgi:hypothetical protein